jgi:hypothetical protein
LQAKAWLLAGAAAALAAGTMAAVSATPALAASLPCDIYASAGTPCVAAHSTVRALYASYNGPLYQVRRASDGSSSSIGTLSAGGYANSAAQDSFCAGTTCTVTEIFDQSPEHNNLTIGPAGGNGGADVGGTDGNKVQMWDCDTSTGAQDWTINSNGTLTIDGGCMDITGANFSNGTLTFRWAVAGRWQRLAAGGWPHRNTLFIGQCHSQSLRRKTT